MLAILIKNANESPGEIHPTALTQLAQYQAIAMQWPRYPDGRAIRCGKCDQSLWFIYDEQDRPFIYDESETLALTVAHIRQRHEGDDNEPN